MGTVLRSLAVAVPILVQLVMVIWLPRDTFWVTDEGNRFIQVQSLARGRVEAPRVEYPGRVFDRELRFLPDGGMHFLRRHGTVVPYYPPYFPWLAVSLVQALGCWGLWVLPLAAAAGSLVVFGLMLGELGVERWRWVGVLTLGVGSPLLFYGLTFWEHSTDVLLVLGGLTLLLAGMRRQRWTSVLLAGVLLGLSTVLREEGYLVMTAALAAAVVVWRRFRPAALIAAGWLIVMLPTWLLQQTMFGSWLGFHASIYDHMAGSRGFVPRILEELQDAWFYLARLSPEPWLAVILCLPLIVLVAAPRSWRPAALWATVVSAAVAAGLAITAPAAFARVLDTQVLLLHVPLLAIVLALAVPLWLDGAPARFALLIVAVFTALAVIPLHRHDVGMIWGPRHFLPVIPLILALAMLTAERVHGCLGARSLRLAVGALVIVSVALQIQGLHLLALKRFASQRLVATLQESGREPVVSDAFWLAEDAAALYYTRPFFFVYSDVDLVQLMNRLEGAGLRRLVVVLGERYRTLSGPMRAALRRQAAEDRWVRTEGVGPMDVEILEVPLN